MAKHIITDNSDLIEEVLDMRQNGTPERKIQQTIYQILKTRKRKIDKQNAWRKYERSSNVPPNIKIKPINL